MDNKHTVKRFHFKTNNFQTLHCVCYTKCFCDIGAFRCKFFSDLGDILRMENHMTQNSLCEKSFLLRHQLYLHEVTKALLAQDIFEEHQVLFMGGIWMELRGEQGQSLMQPCTPQKI